MNFKEYLKSKGLKSKYFAELLGVNPSHVSQWVTGKTIPRKETILKIEKLTDGKVKPGDWFREENTPLKQQINQLSA